MAEPDKLIEAESQYHALLNKLAGLSQQRLMKTLLFIRKGQVVKQACVWAFRVKSGYTGASLFSAITLEWSTVLFSAIQLIKQVC